jgi:hypothetical protein
MLESVERQGSAAEVQLKPKKKENMAPGAIPAAEEKRTQERAAVSV